MLIEAEEYLKIKSMMPIPCVDLIVCDHEKKILMLKRKNQPAKHEWWFPGGRIYFGENRLEAVRRKLKEECGLNANTITEQMTKDCILPLQNGKISHAITTVYLVYATGEITIDEQSESFEKKTQEEWLNEKINPFLLTTLQEIKL